MPRNPGFGKWYADDDPVDEGYGPLGGPPALGEGRHAFLDLATEVFAELDPDIQDQALARLPEGLRDDVVMLANDYTPVDIARAANRKVPDTIRECREAESALGPILVDLAREHRENRALKNWATQHER